MSDPFNVAGRAFVVTGGAGHLGTHICAGLARAGAAVLCLSSRLGEFGKLPPCRGRIEPHVCDVQDEAEVERHIAKFATKVGCIDGLVNGAVRAPRRPNLDMPTKEFTAALDSILTHYFTTARIAARHMSEGGSIVNMVSMWGLRAPDLPAYLDLKNEPSLAMAAGAGGIYGLTRYLAVVMAPSKVRVNALVPGWFPRKRGADRPDYMREITRRVPLGRIGDAEELVGSVQYLLSRAASYMTGQTLVVDGGYTIR